MFGLFVCVFVRHDLAPRSDVLVLGFADGVGEAAVRIPEGVVVRRHLDLMADHPGSHFLRSRQGCDRVAVVVTRWYGGIKLGAGGLVRAYGGTAAECLRLAERRPLVAMAALELACAFEDLGAVHVALAAHAAEKTGERFEADGAHLSLSLPAARIEALQARLRDATRDRVRFPPPVSAEIH